jgi:fatty acid desaturase
MGWFYSQFGIVMMHDGAHGAFSSNPTISKLASLVRFSRSLIALMPRTSSEDSI